MKKVVTAAIVVLASTGLVACAEGGGSVDNPKEKSSYFYELEDGRVVECILIDRGGSCDWDGA